MAVPEVRFIYVTARERIQAEEIGLALVRERLAACANVLDGMRSFYWWQGEIKQDSEAVLILKTTATLADAAIARIKALHSYDCPCIELLPVVGGYGPYLDWVRQETTPHPKKPA
ncbi:MAG TPA: divalent-cation tolerance protein CutA [Stellaceae bacterium]|nr:divalent-cation tolerance protein CutA [Stellaceae bacterium]